MAASPLARRAAALSGVDLATVRGTGPGGMVTRADVLAAAASGNGRAQARVPPAPPAAEAGRPAVVSRPPAAPPAEGTTPLRGPAAALAAAMEQSREIPTATSFRTVEVDSLADRRRQLNDALRIDQFSDSCAVGLHRGRVPRRRNRGPTEIGEARVVEPVVDTHPLCNLRKRTWHFRPAV